jgi:peptidoglycan/xylan/chitin deacetylase (PgdA/CDA1 family)
LVDVVAPPKQGVTILIYHRVGRRQPIEIDLPREVFDDQLAWLTANAEVVSLDDALESLHSPSPPARQQVVITFDDGTTDFADEVMPIVQRHGVPVTLYVATDYVDRGLSFPDDGAAISWSALADCVATGLVDVGSHTHTHALLDRLDAPAVRDELDRSIGLIRDRLGTDATHFAYPKALLGSPDAQQAVRDRFQSAAIAMTRPNRFGQSDPYRLYRTPIQVSDGMRWFERKARGGMHAEDTLRRQLNRYRYRGRTT